MMQDRIRQITERADAINHRRGRTTSGTRGSREEGARGASRGTAWLQRLAFQKQVFMLTATPVNNSLIDLMHLIEIWAGDGSALKRAPLGIHSLQGHFRQLEKRVANALGQSGDLFSAIDDDVTGGEAHEIFASDPIVQNLVVQRSRAYVKESQKREAKGTPAQFPTREDPQVADYEYSELQKKLLDRVDSAFDKRKSLFSLAIYNPEEFRRPGQGEAADFDRGRLKQVVTLIRTGFLKRLESSTPAFETSCQNLLIKLLTFVERHALKEPEKRRLKQWKDRHAEVLDHTISLRAAFKIDDDDEADEGPCHRGHAGGRPPAR